jgi:metal-dependent amidase/aminoacylase/carboxypeptidase family protein
MRTAPAVLRYLLLPAVLVTGILAGDPPPASSQTVSPPLQELRAEIDREADRLEDQVIEWRRHFYQNPELSNREFETAATVTAFLEGLGLEVQTGIAHTGVVGLLDTGHPGPVIALRADMDALPVEDRADVPFRSTATGEYRGREVPVKHACGHDTHIAMSMGATAEVEISRGCPVTFDDPELTSRMVPTINESALKTGVRAHAYVVVDYLFGDG